MYLLLIALLLSPVFLWRSGLPQLSHLFAAAALGERLIDKPRTIYYEKDWITLPLFLIYSSLVAVVFFIGYKDPNTLLAPIYYIFGFLVFLTIIAVYIEKREQFLKYIFWLHLALLAVVTASSALGIGRIGGIVDDGYRMMFSFNNPNQMANWAIWVAVIIAVCGWSIYKSWIPGFVALIFSVMIVGFSISRSGFMGVAALVLFYCFLGVYILYKYCKTLIRNNPGRHIWPYMLLIVLVAALVTFILIGSLFEYEAIGSNPFVPLLNRMINTDIYFELELRSYDRLWRFPQYLIFGAGEGAYYRFQNDYIFELLGVNYEMHSSWAGLLFSYGIIGFLLFMRFLYVLIRRFDLIWFKLILIGPFLFGFSSYNLRNWYFWVSLALIYCCVLNLEEKRDKKHELCRIDLDTIYDKLRKRFKKRVTNAEGNREDISCRRLS